LAWAWRPDHEEGRLHALRGENIQNLVAVFRQWTVVEGQHDLAILERQRFTVLHGADQAMLFGVDHQRARGAERLGMAGAIAGTGGAGRDGGEKSQYQRGSPPRPDANPNITGHHIPPAFQNALT